MTKNWSALDGMKKINEKSTKILTRSSYFLLILKMKQKVEFDIDYCCIDNSQEFLQHINPKTKWLTR